MLDQIDRLRGRGASGLPVGAHDNPLRSEAEQSVVRFVFALFGVGIGWIAYTLAGAGDLPWTLWPYAGGYIAYSALCLLHVRQWPDFNRLRLVMTTLLDPLLVTTLLWAGGERTTPLVWTYFWFVTAQGVRYGTPWMLLSAGTTAAAVATLVWLEPGWRQHASYAVGIVLSLAAVAIFLSIANMRLSALQRRLIQMASHDPLTGVANRSMFYDLLMQAIWRCQRNHKRLAVLSFDLDGFKLVNDTHGHRAGDYVLKAFASRLAPTLRREDVFARIGGDEFVILLENISGPANVSRVSELILSTLASIEDFEGHAVAISASIGVATYPFLAMPDEVTPDHLLACADAAMYKAKSAGRSRTCVDVSAMLDDGELLAPVFPG
ncbi:MAG TPA: GGDEF domain-containing protein [Rhodospirillaceae bacterium]|nr:GGDEF domain-containing protein [Rhodospirillaceae bacterium]